jgi:hypothetical protein
MQLPLNAEIGMSLSEIKEFLRMRPPATNQQVPINPNQPTNQLRGFSLRANYTDRVTAACRRS